MKDAVLIKSYQSGITLLMREDASLEEILQELAVKFTEAKNFFGTSTMALSMEGREVTEVEEIRILDTIRKNSNVRIACIADMVGTMMSSISTIINAISYVLMAFVAISLVVSSIMIGIITYISVLERTKEIGVLRSIGASKKDISRVFNAETIIIGFVAGLIGIGVTVLLNIPINAVIHHFAGLTGVAKLPVTGGALLVAISVVLTMIGGLIPSRVASKKDPVEALRSE